MASRNRRRLRALTTRQPPDARNLSIRFRSRSTRGYAPSGARIVGQSTHQCGWTPPPARNHSRHDDLTSAEPFMSSDLSRTGPVGGPGGYATAWRVTAHNRSTGLFTPSAPFCITCRYVIVVRTSRCPSSSCTVRMSYPASSRCIAKQCRSVCGPTRLAIPAARAACATAFCTPTRAGDTATAPRNADHNRCAPRETRTASASPSRPTDACARGRTAGRQAAPDRSRCP